MRECLRHRLEALSAATFGGDVRRPVRFRLVLVTACAVLSILIAPAAGAQSTTQQPAEGERQAGEFEDFEELELADLLNQTVSIAAGAVQRVEEAPAIVSVITDEDIRRMGLRTLADVLSIVPGFEVLNDNLGRDRIVVRGVYPQGISVSENVLVLFNGHRLNDHMWGGATVTNPRISLHNIKQIEVIRGPGSALFGTHAFVGVINLVPYTATTFNGLEVDGSGGSFDTAEITATAGRTWGRLGIVGSVAFLDTDGPALPVAVDAQTLVDRLTPLRAPISLAPTTTRGGFDSGEFNVNLSYRGLTVDARLSDATIAGYIGPFDIFGVRNQFDSRQALVGVKQRLSLTARTALSANLHFAENRGRGFSNPLPPGWVRVRTLVGPSLFRDGLLIDHSENTRRYVAEGSVEHRLSPQNVVIGAAAYERESTFGLSLLANYDPISGAALPRLVAQPNTRIPPYAREVSSAFAQTVWNPSAQLGLTLGLRFDHYSDFGNAFSPRAGVVWRPQRFVYVKGLYGHAFRAPTLTELFMVSQLRFGGNPDLRPSTSDTYEVSAGYRSPRLTTSATLFITSIDDLISSERPFTVAEGFATPFNGPELTVRGIEIEARRPIGLDHVVFGNYTYQRPTSSAAAQRPAFVPRHLGTVGATAGFSRFFDVTATTVLRGERTRAVSDTRAPVGAYAITNLNLRAKELLDIFELSVTIDNLFDVEYASPSPDLWMPGDYPRPGRSVLAKARFRY
jgi:iron complex outermembrane receptor protein